MNPSPVLIVEDQAPVARAIALLLELHGIEPVVAPDPDAALAIVRRRPVAAVVQDMNFSPGATSGAEGIELFRRLRELEPRLPVLLLTAFASLETAVRLMKEGAADYIQKPWDDERLLGSVRELITRGAVGGQPGAAAGTEDLARQHDLCGLVYASPAMDEVVRLALKVARADVPVLITGPNGTGKEKLAELVRANSPRRDGPFVIVNAGALPATLVEAELFGAEAGAYTGAARRRTGRFEAADGGTLLLDEIGNLPLEGQATLLRVLQSGQLERLGSSTPVQVDVRVLAATNTDLERAIAEGTFREDLYFRLNVIELALPPLADRPEDVLPLAEHFLAEVQPSPDGVVRRLGAAARSALLAYDWPGNVRELRNRVLRASLVAAGDEIAPADLDLGRARAPAAPSGAAASERRSIEAALESADGVVARAAEQLGLSRQALYRRMERLGIVLERRPRS